MTDDDKDFDDISGLYECESPESSAEDSELGFNGKTGVWSVAGMALETKVLRIVLVAFSRHRTMFNTKSQKEGQRSFVVCESWDGKNAYGLGRRPAPGEPWEGDCADRACDDCPLSDYYKVGKEDWCAPKVHALVMATWPELQGEYRPFILELGGRSVRSIEQAWTRVRMAAKSRRVRMMVDGEWVMKPERPWWGFTLRLETVKKGTSFMVNSEPPVWIADGDTYRAIDAEVRSPQVVEMWKAEKRRREAKARKIGADVEEGGSGGADFDEVPF